MTAREKSGVAVTAGLASGVTTMVAHLGGPPLAMYLLPLGLRGNDESVLHRRQRDQGGAVAAAGEADSRRLDIDDGRASGWAASRHALPASDLSRLPRIAGRDRVENYCGTECPAISAEVPQAGPPRSRRPCAP